jgi:hypothetical protein
MGVTPLELWAVIISIVAIAISLIVLSRQR